MSAAAPNFTKQQAAAIRTREVSVALSAGAGCGKTFVLTQRFLSHLQPGPDCCELHSLVAITFTDRAAREMRDRIRSVCQVQLQHCPTEQVSHWLDILRGLDTARISTIHSFCSALLRSHAVEAGIDPRFALLEETLGDAFLRQVVTREVHNRLARDDQDCFDLVLHFGLEGTRDLLRTLVLQRFRVEFARFDGLTPEALAQDWLDRWQRDCIPRMIRDLVESPQTARLLDLLRQHTPSNAVMQQRCRFLLDQLPHLLQCADLGPLLTELRRQAMVKGGGGKSAWPDEIIYETVKDGLDSLRKSLERLSESLLVTAADVRTATRFSLLAARVTQRAVEAYERAKREASVLDFDDLLLRTRNLLRDFDGVRQRVANGIRLLMVDEFQDTDPVQCDIVRMLCGDVTGGKLFLVGDVKQSIYRFRRADPSVFTNLRQTIPEAGRLPLSVNFRSQPEILRFVNRVFTGAMGTDYEPLTPFHNEQLSPPPCIEFLFATPWGRSPTCQNSGRLETCPTTSDDGESERETADQLRRREAEWIARRIAALLADDTPRVREKDPQHGERLRPVKPGDIVILFRALSNVQLYEEALRDNDLEYYLVGGRAFYAQQEVYDLVNLCQYLDDGDDEVSLVGVLRSPFFSFSDDTLYALGAHGRSLSQALDHPVPSLLPEDQQQQARYAAAVLGELRAKKDRIPLAELLNLALERTGYDAALLNEYLGRRKVANLRKLIDQARDFDRVGLFTLKDFVERLRESVSEQADEELAATNPEAGDVIRLMSIHQSKGLEFPVVVVADMDRKGPPKTQPAYFHPELGPLLTLPSVHGEKPENLGQRMHKQQEEREDEAETKRLLYVAMTRAADHLILSAGLKANREPTTPWMKLLAERFDLDTGLPVADPYLGTFAFGAVAPDEIPKIFVHHEPPPEPERARAKSLKTLPLAQFRQAVIDAEPCVLPETVRRFGPDTDCRSLFSVSEIEAAAESGNGRLFAPGELTEPLSTDAEILGTLVHGVLERTDFQHPESINQLLDAAIATDHSGVAPQLRERARQQLQKLMESRLALELSWARQRFQELEFLLHWPPSGSAPSTSKCLITGKIDCLYQAADGRWHILDYKTGRSTGRKDAEILAEYEIQLGLYALAVKQLLGKLPDAVELALLQAEFRCVPLKLTDARLKKIMGRVDAALQRLRSAEA